MNDLEIKMNSMDFDKSAIPLSDTERSNIIIQIKLVAHKCFYILLRAMQNQWD